MNKKTRLLCDCDERVCFLSATWHHELLALFWSYEAEQCRAPIPRAKPSFLTQILIVPRLLLYEIFNYRKIKGCVIDTILHMFISIKSG